jgi:hypothetical protein
VYCCRVTLSQTHWAPKAHRQFYIDSYRIYLTISRTFCYALCGKYPDSVLRQVLHVVWVSWRYRWVDTKGSGSNWILNDSLILCDRMNYEEIDYHERMKEILRSIYLLPVLWVILSIPSILDVGMVWDVTVILWCNAIPDAVSCRDANYVTLGAPPLVLCFLLTSHRCPSASLSR